MKIQVDTATLVLLTGTVIPLLTGVLTKARASSRTKAVLNLLLSGVAGAAAFLAQQTGPVEWQLVVGAALATHVVSGVFHHNVWKPTGVTDAIQTRTAAFGLGSAPAPA